MDFPRPEHEIPPFRTPADAEIGSAMSAGVMLGPGLRPTRCGESTWVGRRSLADREDVRGQWVRLHDTRQLAADARFAV